MEKIGWIAAPTAKLWTHQSLDFVQSGRNGLHHEGPRVMNP